MLTRFLQWRQAHVSQLDFAYVIAALVGFMCGIAACILKFCIHWVTYFLTCHLSTGFNWQFLIYPIIGIVLTVALCRFVFKYSPSHGTDKILDALKTGDLKLRPSLTFSSILMGTVTLGFGGSAGGEGPIAYTGAAIGSNIAQKLQFDQRLMRIMVGCGAGAGIAGIFKAPLGGALYSLEVLHMELSNPAILALFVAVIIASLTAYAVSGFTFDIVMDQQVPFDWHWLGWVIFLGVICGLYSMYYSFFMKWLARQLGRLSNVWIKGLIGGAIIAVCLATCPILYGEGYGTIGKVINGHIHGLLAGSFLNGQPGVGMLILMCGMTMALKTFACSATNYGGGVAGQFAPTLFAGCIVGLFFALCVNTLFGADISVAHFSFFAMAGVFAGIIGAPLMGIFLVCEMSGSFGYFLPVAVCVAISIGTINLSKLIFGVKKPQQQ